MSRVIEMIVSPRGATTIQTKGFSGGNCLQSSRWLEQALGIATHDTKTAEYYESAKTDQHVQQK